MAIEISVSRELITSKNNPLVVRVGKLSEKKYRDEERLFRADGVKLFCEALRFGAPIEYVFIREDALDTARKLAEKEFSDASDIIGRKKIDAILLSRPAFEKITEEKASDGIVTVIRYLDNMHMNEPENIPFVEKTVVLDAVRDPGNLGAILRSAAAFGMKRVVMSRDCADIYNPKTLRASMGAVFKIATVSCEALPETVSRMRSAGHKIYATALNENARKLGSFEIAPSDAFLIGNEGHGLAEELISVCDETVFIPMAPGTESLNAAVAASICMWESARAERR